MSDLIGPRYSVEGQIGGGGMAEVFAASEVGCGRPVAIKKIKIASSQKVTPTVYLHQIFSIDHPCVVRIENFFIDDDYLCIVMERGSRPLTQSDSQPCTEPHESFSFILRDITAGLAYLHEMDFVHRDLKPKNILLFDDGGDLRAKISDIDSIKPAHTSLIDNTVGLATPQYLAPEMRAELSSRGSFTNSKETDVWAMGLVIRWLLTEMPPTPDTTEVTLPDNFRGADRDILEQCFNRVPAKRPKARELANHFASWSFDRPSDSTTAQSLGSLPTSAPIADLRPMLANLPHHVLHQLCRDLQLPVSPDDNVPALVRKLADASNEPGQRNHIEQSLKQRE